MNSKDIKTGLKKLWKETFHDTDEYINLIFDTYYDESLVEYEESNSQIVAGLLGVPYEFGNADNKLRGLYLCGLATNSQFRSRGIMTRLLSRINAKAAEAGYAFTFLIPADPGLRKYYHDREYVNAFYRVEDNYTSLHDFDREYESILLEQKEKVADLKRKYHASLITGKIDKSLPKELFNQEAIQSLILEKESAQNDLQIIHSQKDIDTIIAENILSGGVVYYVKTSSGKVTACAFTTADENCVSILKLYANDMASRYKLLQFIKQSAPEKGIREFVSSVEMDRKALWSRTYGSVMPGASQVPEISVTERVYSLAAHSKVYGMARILNLREILEFQAANRHDLKYSILAKGSDNYSFHKIEAKNGKVQFVDLSIENLTPSQAAYVMSKRDIGEILFRRRDTDNMITEALGIPSINASASLLLD